MYLSQMGKIVDYPYGRIHLHGRISIPTDAHEFARTHIDSHGRASIIGGYKSRVTKIANRNGLRNGWQTQFYDRIIHDLQEFERFSNFLQTIRPTGKNINSG
jgi:hypothetical protein